MDSQTEFVFATTLPTTPTPRHLLHRLLTEPLVPGLRDPSTDTFALSAAALKRAYYNMEASGAWRMALELYVKAQCSEYSQIHVASRDVSAVVHEDSIWLFVGHMRALLAFSMPRLALWIAMRLFWGIVLAIVAYGLYAGIVLGMLLIQGAWSAGFGSGSLVRRALGMGKGWGIVPVGRGDFAYFAGVERYGIGGVVLGSVGF